MSQPGGQEEDTELTTAELTRHKEYLTSMAEFYGISDPPDVEVQRWVMPEEVGAAINSCVLEQGYKLLEDGVTWAVPEKQKPAFQLAQYSCTAMYPPLPEYTKEWSDKQISAQYDWTIESVIPCLEERGHSITGVPSRQAFIDDYRSNAFFPFSQVSGLSNAEWAELESSCPQIAPSEKLFAN